MRLGVLGGTFNPVHYGHLRAAEEVREALHLESVIFMPAGNPPLKHEGLVPAVERFEMVRLAIAATPYFQASDLELEGEGKSYTVDTIQRLRAAHPGAEFFFILGIDAFADLPRWKDPARLVSSLNFAVTGRPGWKFSSLEDSPYLSVPQEALWDLDQGRLSVFETALPGGTSAILLRLGTPAVSSSEIRVLLGRGRSIKYLLPENVESFIMSRGLYARTS